MSDQVDGIIKNLLEDIQKQLNSRVEQTVTEQVKKILASYDFESKINLLTSLKLDNKISGVTVRPIDIEARINDSADRVITDITTQARKQISADVARKIDSIDFNSSITNAVAQRIEARLVEFEFPEESMSWKAIKQKEVRITGDNISGGIVQNFSSTGIDDRATSIAVTVLDEHTIIENNLIAASSNIKGTLVVEGDLIVRGIIPTDTAAFRDIVQNAQSSVLAKIDQNLFAGYTNLIFEKMQRDGIDLNRITVNGEEIISGNRIGNRIVESNLQRLGLVKDLQTQGESLLSETLYVSNKRVGINTIEPGHALSVWDQEVEIVAAKRTQNTGMFGTVRQQEFVLSSNNKNNIVCRTDGSVVVQLLQVGDVPMSSSSRIPASSQPKGTILWNSDPDIGKPIGWVSLGNARWAEFGQITE